MCAMNSLYWVWRKGGRTSSPREHKIFQPICLFLLPLKVRAQKTYQMSHIAEPRPCSSFSNTLSFSSFPRWRLSVALPLSLTFSPHCDASGLRETGSQHKGQHSLCLNDTLHYSRRITCLRGDAGSSHEDRRHFGSKIFHLYILQSGAII